MKTTRASLVILFFPVFFILNSNSGASEYFSTGMSISFNNAKFVEYLDSPPIAVNDTFVLVVGCGNNAISGDVMANDGDPDGDPIALTFVYALSTGSLSISNKGVFTFRNFDGFVGEATFKYRICETGNYNSCSEGIVVIFVKNDNDCDGVADADDIDDDNDGILDIHEGEGLIDFDGDGIVDCWDIDSDNDGITDNVEWQIENEYITITGTDSNGDGWDDAYDSGSGGNYYEQVDTDSDGYPDFIDTDSDDDGALDIVEGNDTNFDGIADVEPVGLDSDLDGLDEAYDLVAGWLLPNNSTGSDVPLADHDNNGVRDWRDANDTPIIGEDIFVDVFDVTVLSLRIFPNPTKGIFNLKVSEMIVNQGLKLEMYGLDGKLHYEKKIVSNENIINPGNVDSGGYIIKLKSDTQNYTQRLLINR